MTNILLVCNAGMSTSILVEAMKKSAKEQEKDVHIWAIADVEIENHWQQADVILIGPQVGYLKQDIVSKTGGTIPVTVIDFVDYGRVNGQGVLDQAQQMMEGQ